MDKLVVYGKHRAEWVETLSTLKYQRERFRARRITVELDRCIEALQTLIAMTEASHEKA